MYSYIYTRIYIYIYICTACEAKFEVMLLRTGIDESAAARVSRDNAKTKHLVKNTENT